MSLAAYISLASVSRQFILKSRNDALCFVRTSLITRLNLFTARSKGKVKKENTHVQCILESNIEIFINVYTPVSLDDSVTVLLANIVLNTLPVNGS